MAVVSPDQPVTKRLSLDLGEVDQSTRDRIKAEVGQLIIDEINDHLDESRSPVAGGSYKRLKADGERSILFEYGDMRDSLEWRDAGGDEIEVGIWNRSETPKAYNHTVGDTLPQREFIPADRDSFRRSIMDKIDDTVKRIKEGKPRTVADALSTFEISVSDLVVGVGPAPGQEPGQTPTGITLGSLINLEDL